MVGLIWRRPVLGACAVRRGGRHAAVRRDPAADRRRAADVRRRGADRHVFGGAGAASSSAAGGCRSACPASRWSPSCWSPSPPSSPARATSPMPPELIRRVGKLLASLLFFLVAARAADDASVAWSRLTRWLMYAGAVQGAIGAGLMALSPLTQLDAADPSPGDRLSDRRRPALRPGPQRHLYRPAARDRDVGRPERLRRHADAGAGADRRPVGGAAAGPAALVLVLLAVPTAAGRAAQPVARELAGTRRRACC